VRDDYIVLGNYLTGEQILEAMERAFTAQPDEDLEERLLRRVFDAYRPAIAYYNLRQVDARVPPMPDWLRDHPR
jgi:hypothetical protein